jgi:hypothetical protein
MASIWFNIHHKTPRQGSDFRSAASLAQALQIVGDNEHHFTFGSAQKHDLH